MHDQPTAASNAVEDDNYQRTILVHVIEALPTALRLTDLIREVGDPDDFAKRDAVGKGGSRSRQRRAAVPLRGRGAADPAGGLGLRTTGVGVTPLERFGRNLFMARRQAGLTQTELALRASKAQYEVSKLERGLRRPSLDSIVRLARTLEMPAGDLLRGIE
jgi:DNA-binding XRE family transcriptional regulator